MPDEMRTRTRPVSLSEIPPECREKLENQPSFGISSLLSNLENQKKEGNRMGFLSSMMDNFKKSTGNQDIDNQNSSGQRSIKNEIESLDEELGRFYRSIGQKYVEHILTHNNVKDFNIDNVLVILKTKVERRNALQNKLDQIEYLEQQQEIQQEKLKYESEYQTQKIKLDKALAMEVIGHEEYETRLKPYKSKVEHFDEMIKIQKQFEMGLIDAHEKKVRLFEIGITENN